jgi:Domain of unknown function (DUF1864)
MFTAAAANSYDAHIATLDPLDADGLMTHLPAANAARDVGWLRRTASQLAERSVRIQHAEYACAALRDLGFVISSLGRHQPAALECCPWQPQLRRLGTLADEVPRETVYGYASRNPEGRRQRRFTDSAEERLFIASVSGGIRHLNHAIETLAGHAPWPGRADTLRSVLADLDSRLREFASCLVTVKRAITPEFFTGQLRPYFPPLTVNGRTYFGPGGAQMPQLVLDVLLLRPEASAPLAKWHAAYIEENAIYLPVPHRHVIAAALTTPCGLVAHMTRPATTGSDQAGLAALHAVVRSVLRFRYPHQRMAAANMAVRPTGSVGSGGYSLEAVDQLVELTSYALSQLDRMVTL